VGRQKLARFNHNLQAINVLEPEKEGYETIKGNWNKRQFLNENPIVLELACGKGEYTVGMAKKFPNKNFIGIDLKGDRIAVGSKKAITEGLTNVAFLRTNIYFLANFFESNEVSEMWVTFPDPFNIKRTMNRRLTNRSFLNIYKQVLKSEGSLYLKTDSKDLFEYSLFELESTGCRVLQYTYDLYNDSLMLSQSHQILTRFEQIFTERGFKINFLKCVFNNE
jgi:tRNA (guanine-N7-)-methyltransferase